MNPYHLAISVQFQQAGHRPPVAEVVNPQVVDRIQKHFDRKSVGIEIKVVARENAVGVNIVTLDNRPSDSDIGHIESIGVPHRNAIYQES